jgi:hypothetical protein
MPDAAKISVEIEAITGAAQAMLAEFSESVKDFAAQASKQMEGMQKSLSLSTLSHSLGHIKDALAGMQRQVMDCVGAATVWERSVKGLSRTLGISTKEAGGLANALGRLGSDTGTYSGAVFNLQRALTAQEEAFNANGIATRDAGGEMLNIQQVMMNTLDRLRQMKPGYDANALAMLAFGRSAKDLGGITQLTSKQIADGAAKVKALGVEVGEGDTAAQNYRAAMADVNDTMGALKIKVGQDLMPAVARLAQAFSDIAGAAAPALAACFKGLATVTDHWKTALAALVVVLANKLKVAMVELFTTVIPKLIAGVRAFVASLGPIGIAMAAVAAAVVVWDQLANSAKRAANAAADYAKAQAEAHGTTGGKLREYAAQLREVIKLEGKEGADTAALAERKKALLDAIEALGGAGRLYAGTIRDYGPIYDQELHYIDLMEEAHKQDTATMLKSAEAEMAGLSKAADGYAAKAEAVAALRQELIACTGAAVKAGAAFVAPGGAPPPPPKPAKPPKDEAWQGPEPRSVDTKALDAYNATMRDYRLLDLEDARAHADHLVTMGQMTVERRLELEQGFVQRENELRAIGAENAVLAAAEASNRTQEATRRLVEQQSAIWRELGASIKQSVGDAFVSLCNGTQSWGDATKTVMNSVLQSLLKKLSEAVTQELTLEKLKLAAKKMFISQETAAKTEGAAVGAGVTVAGAAQEVTAKAVSAGAGAASSQASIPYVGPILAVAAMASIMAAVMGLMGNLSSAAGGYWDVPSDQLAQIHKNEMVLPARHSAKLRDMLESDEGGMGGKGGGTVNVSISAVDAKSVERLFKANGGALARTLKSQARNFVFNS